MPLQYFGRQSPLRAQSDKLLFFCKQGFSRHKKSSPERGLRQKEKQCYEAYLLLRTTITVATNKLVNTPSGINELHLTRVERV